jgi:hypothetical protein
VSKLAFARHVGHWGQSLHVWAWWPASAACCALRCALARYAAALQSYMTDSCPVHSQVRRRLRLTPPIKRDTGQAGLPATLSAALQPVSACPRRVAVRPVACDLLAAFRAHKGAALRLMHGRCWHAGFSKSMALVLSDLPEQAAVGQNVGSRDATRAIRELHSWTHLATGSHTFKAYGQRA